MHKPLQFFISILSSHRKQQEVNVYFLKHKLTLTRGHTTA